MSRRKSTSTSQGRRQGRNRRAPRREGQGRADTPRLHLRRAHLQLRPARHRRAQCQVQGPLRPRRTLQLRNRRLLLEDPRARGGPSAFRPRVPRHRRLLEHRKGTEEGAALAPPRPRPRHRLLRVQGHPHPRPPARLGQLQVALPRLGKRQASKGVARQNRFRLLQGQKPRRRNLQQ